MRLTQRKGDIATARAIATFTAMGWGRGDPLTESAAYDLLVDDGTRIVRVQCKFSSTRDVDLRRVHHNSGGYVVKRAHANSYDWLYVLNAEGAELLLKERFAGRRAGTPLDVHRLGAVAESG